MEKSVTMIPATKNTFSTVADNQNKHTLRRVAAYARVSTDHEEQQSSYEAQVDYYTRYIQSHPDWQFVSVYSDEGVTGCNTKKRDGFNHMVADALAGQIDLIITKSVSRFARNTVDTLTTIRKLKEKGVECFFEKENIWTFDPKCELILSILASLSQEESRSISENVTWGHRRRFEAGKASVPFGRFLGYDRGKNGELIVNKKQAKIVKRIFAEFLAGASPYQIAKNLTADHIPTPGGKEIWSGCVVRSILQNEKYKGDALLQKVFTPDFLTKKKVKNTGQVPQYYVKGDHEPIIEPEIFDLVQRRMSRESKSSSVSPFSGKVKCGCCMSYYGSKVWHSNSKYRRIIWQCNGKYKKKDITCTTPNLTEDDLKNAFIAALNKLIAGKNEITAAFEGIKDTLFSSNELQTELEQKSAQFNTAIETVRTLIQQNARIAMDQNDYNRRYQEAVKSCEQLQIECDDLQQQIEAFNQRREDIAYFLKQLSGSPSKSV